MNTMQSTQATPMPMSGSRDFVAALKRALTHVKTWTRKTLVAQDERDAFLSHAIDHCDLEARMRRWERHALRSESSLNRYY